MIKTFQILTLIFLALFKSSCGDNSFSQLESNPAEDAVKFLESNEPVKAMRVIFDTLGSEYESIFNSINDESDLIDIQASLNAQMEVLIAEGSVESVENLVSILASAKAQQHGVDPFTVALALATDTAEEGVSENSNELTLLFPVLPEATSDNIRGLNVAITILNSLGNRFSESDYYKSAIFSTSSVSLSLKAIDTDGDGEISPEESLNLDEDTAVNIITQLAIAAAAATLGTTEDDGEKAKANTETISSIQTEIDSQDGESNAEKLRNFISTAEE